MSHIRCRWLIVAAAIVAVVIGGSMWTPQLDERFVGTWHPSLLPGGSEAQWDFFSDGTVMFKTLVGGGVITEVSQWRSEGDVLEIGEGLHPLRAKIRWLWSWLTRSGPMQRALLAGQFQVIDDEQGAVLLVDELGRGIRLSRTPDKQPSR